MSNEQNAIPNRPSLLDRIHLFREFATRAGWSDVAEWLTKHADEPCPAAIAEFVGVDAVVEERCFQCAHFQSTAADVCPNAVSADGAHKWGHFKLSTDPEPSELSRTEAMREAIALAAEHNGDGGCEMHNVGSTAAYEHEIAVAMRPLLAALADAERKLACGHPASLLVRSVESNHEYCQLCETRDRLRDALAMEREYAYKLTGTEKRVKERAQEALSCIGDGAALGSLRAFVRRIRDAIDAPAVEKAPIPPGGRCPMEDDMESPTPSEERAAKAAKSSVPRFTAAEARAFADTYDSRNEATLLYYAAMLDRDDALERAAAGALKLLHDVFDFTKRTPQVEATIANLSAVLAQRAGKVE